MAKTRAATQSRTKTDIRTKPDTKPIGVSEMLRRARDGDILFIGDTSDNSITAHARSVGRRVSTERVLCLQPKTKSVEEIIRVTVLPEEEVEVPKRRVRR